MYLNEQISESIGRQYAKDIDAMFKLTSAKTGQGIEDLFNQIGKRYLNLNQNRSHAEDKTPTKLSQPINIKSKKRCC